MAEQDWRELEATLSLQNAILSCRNFNDVSRNILGPLARYVEADTGCFLQFLAPGEMSRDIGRNSCYEVNKASHSNYIASHFYHDPAANPVMLGKGQTTNVFRTSDICDYSFFTRSDVYNEFFRPNHLHHILVAAIRADGAAGERLIFGFHRPKNASPFSERSKNRLRRMTSALSCSVRGMMLQEEMAVREAAIDYYETSHPETGLLFFDDQMTLLFGNPEGLKYLNSGSRHGMAENKSRILARIRDACRILQRRGLPDDGSEVITSPGEDMVVTIHGRYDSHARQLFSVHIEKNESHILFNTRCADMGMTRREVDVIQLVAAGLSNADIADRLCISIRTVENHLRAIYSKGGVNKRTQLLHRLMKH